MQESVHAAQTPRPDMSLPSGLQRVLMMPESCRLLRLGPQFKSTGLGPPAVAPVVQRRPLQSGRMPCLNRGGDVLLHGEKDDLSSQT